MAAAADPRVIDPPGPLAVPRPRTSVWHGKNLVDDFFYLRERDNPEVLKLCEDENAYVKQVMGGTEALQKDLYAEMRGRIKEEDVSAAVRRGPYLYYHRTEQDKQYSVQCRKRLRVDPDEMRHNPEILPTDLFCQPEEIVLDENKEAEGSEYYRATGCSVAPTKHEIVVYGEDRVGDEMYTLRFRALGEANPAFAEAPIPKCSGQVAWASDDDQTLFYITKNKLDRPDKVWRHRMGTTPDKDQLIFEEVDELYCVDVERSDSGDFVFVTSTSSETTKGFFVNARDPSGRPRRILPITKGVEYQVFDRNGLLYLVTNADGATNFKLVSVKVAGPDNDAPIVEELIAHRKDVRLESVQLFQGHLVVEERENGLTRIVVYDFESPESHVINWDAGPRTLPIKEECYSLHASESPYKSAVLRYKYSSLTTPWSTYETFLDDLTAPVLKKRTPVGGRFNPNDYESKRLWATSHDGVRVPISLVYRRSDLRPNQPTCLYGYGAYGISYDPSFSSNMLSLLDRGLCVAIAHVRGGGDLGRQWYLDGKYLLKKNSFLDFIWCAQYLKSENISGGISISGRSAGGLLIGAVLNLAPDGNDGNPLFEGAVLGVPFVDTLSTMLDETLPLTVGEYLEWGNPKNEAYYNYIASYSPVDNVDPNKRYPPVFLSGGLNDPRVGYWEPLKLAQKLRRANCEKVLCKIEMGAGHFSKSGRFDRLEELALEYAFLLQTLKDDA